MVGEDQQLIAGGVAPKPESAAVVGEREPHGFDGVAPTLLRGSELAIRSPIAD
jgi:hypothetical protein